MSFDGITYSEVLDGPRLTSQLFRTKKLMADGKWRSLPAIAKVVGGSESAISARLRDLRKARWGGFNVECVRLTGGTFMYRIKIPTLTEQVVLGFTDNSRG